MLRYFGTLSVALSLGLVCPALAQDTAQNTGQNTGQPAPDSKITLELNGAADTEAGGCQLTIVATNRLDKGLKRAAWQVAMFDKAGAVQALPILDFWPWRYATDYEFQPGPACPEPLPRQHPDFHACYTAVGDFPEVNVGPKLLLVRMLTAFGAGLVPIL